MFKPSRLFAGLAIALVVVQLAACKKKPTAQPAPSPAPAPPAAQPTPTPPPPPPAATPRPTPPPPPQVKSEDDVFAAKSIDDLMRERVLGDVLFAYDVAVLTDSARSAIQKNADWLKRWTSVRVRVEGHADARGTNEYNFALGERRASAIKEYLIALGIAAARIETVSKGEEDPICKEDGESCWEQNRRGHFVITAK